MKKEKKTSDERQNTTQKTKHQATRTPLKRGGSSCTPEGYAFPAPVAAPVLLLLLEIQWYFMNHYSVYCAQHYPPVVICPFFKIIMECCFFLTFAHLFSNLIGIDPLIFIFVKKKLSACPSGTDDTRLSGKFHTLINSNYKTCFK